MKKIILLLLIALSTLATAQKKTVAADENFDAYFSKFNGDKTFQISRIKFPLAIKSLDDDLEMANSKITQKEYQVIKLSKSAEYTYKIIFKDKQAIIQKRGIDNGIYIDYHFEKRNGLWFLKTWIDSST